MMGAFHRRIRRRPARLFHRQRDVLFIVAIGVSLVGFAACSESRGDAGAKVEFSELRAEDIGATRAVVRFRTSLATTCEVQYGRDPHTLDQVATNPAMSLTDPFVLVHDVPLEDLTPATTYHYRARAITPQGGSFLSATQSFATLPAGTSSLINVALISRGATVIERSSNYGGGGDTDLFGAAAAFDGQMTTEWSTAGDGDGAYVVVDLGSVRHLEGVAFRSREMADGTSIVRRFRLVINGVTMGPFSSPDPAQRYQFDLVPPVDARVVRFEAVETTGGNTGAREIELLAAPL